MNPLIFITEQWKAFFCLGHEGDNMKLNWDERKKTLKHWFGCDMDTTLIFHISNGLHSEISR